MSHRGQRPALSLHTKLRCERLLDKNLRMQEFSRQRELVIQQHHVVRIDWWQRTFRDPRVASNWVSTQAFSIWSAILYSLGLQPKIGKLFSCSGNLRSNELQGNELQGTSRHAILRGLFYEPLEARQLLAVDSIQATLSSGNLTIADVFSGGLANTLSVSRSGSNLVVTDAVEQFVTASVPAGGSLSNGNRTLTIPLSSVTGKLIFDTGLANDVVNVDFSGGTPIPTGGLDFNAGENSGDDDQLRLVGYSLTVADGVADVSVVHTGPESGFVVLAGLGTVNFTQIEPMTLAGTAADLSITLPAGAYSITLGDDVGVQDPNGNTANTSALYDSTGPAYSFEYTEFTNPTNSLTVLRGSATDNLTVFDLVTSGFSASLTAGTTTDRFASANILGAITLATSRTLSLYADSITSSGPITTSGGAITLDANTGITINKPILSNGGVQTLHADADGDGTGTLSLNLAIAQLVDPNPAPGNQFGDIIVVLTSGNIVVISPFDDFAGTDAGAIYLFNGLTGAVISTLRGSRAGDLLFSSVTALNNGNYVVRSSSWDNGTAINAGAVTWGSGTAGVSGVVSSAKSLVGSTASDFVGDGGVIALSNGNYLVRSSSNWNNGSVIDAGAVTWGSGTAGVSGVVSAANSLVGSTASDVLGNGGVIVLSNGNYVVRSGLWDNGTVINAGAVTWGSGTAGVSGVIGPANSLIGSSANDAVGSDNINSTFINIFVTALSNGNYVVRSPFWDNGIATNAGAVTWGSGTSGVSGVVSAANSLVGLTANDMVGSTNVIRLSNGNYVVPILNWDNGTITNAGAVTWGTGTAGVSGAVSATNSLVGSKASDQVGSGGVTTLNNGNYVVRSLNWDNGTVTNAGAITWGTGTAGVSGVVSVTNSLVGSTASDSVGNVGVTALNNGNYIVSSRDWDNGTVSDAGAVTWGSGTAGISGVVSAANSLVGSTAFDFGGDFAVTALSNGNYVVSSPSWDNGTVTDAGAVTWGDGMGGVSGMVSGVNSLVGSTASDLVGGVTALSNGNYVVNSSNWDNGAVTDAGAVTWGSGTAGVSGVVSAANSLVGSRASDLVGGIVTALSNGNYVVSSSFWDNGMVQNAGAVTWGSGTSGLSGVVSSANSLVGSRASDLVGNSGVTALSNGNYVVLSTGWSNGTVTNAGAVTWGSGSAGVSGVVSAANSLIGSSTFDFSNMTSVTALSNGNYVVSNRFWDNGTLTDAGAVTWGNGSSGVIGLVSAANSLVGSSDGDSVGSSGVTALSNGNYVVASNSWRNGTLNIAGAITWGSGTSGVSGVVSSANSVVGNSSSAGSNSGITFNTSVDTLVARFPLDGSGRVIVGSQSQGFGSVTGSLNSGAGSISLRAADANLLGSISSSNSVSIAPQQTNRLIDLGTNTAGALGLTDTELDLITTSSLQIGNASSGTIMVSSGITRPTSTNLQLRSGGAIAINPGSINTAGGTLVFDAGTGGVQPISSGTDVTASSVSFAAGDDLAIHIVGTTVDTQYGQLNVAGAVNLTGANLNVTLGFQPTVGNSFTIINNDLTDAVVGIFNNLPQGSTFNVITGLFSQYFQISYIGGDGNDVVLTAIASPNVASIAGRNVFYNNASGFGTSGANATDPLVNPINAIDPTKSALLPGGTASIANYTNYSRGLNGLVIDITNPANLAAIDSTSFQFATWSTFPDATPNFLAITPTVTVSTFATGGQGGSARVKLTFADRAIENAWLRVTVLANLLTTGLLANDIFYFGNARFDVNPPAPAFTSQVGINVLDTNQVRAQNGQNPGVVSNVFDVDRSGAVNVLDTNATRAGNGVNSLRFFNAPASLQLARSASFAAPAVLSQKVTKRSLTDATDAFFSQF